MERQEIPPEANRGVAAGTGWQLGGGPQERDRGGPAPAVGWNHGPQPVEARRLLLPL